MTAGVYQILNKISGMSYIGSSTNIESRFVGHKSSLRRKTHSNPRLQADWDLLGEDAFIFNILEELYNASALVAVETRYLKQLAETIYNRELKAKGSGIALTQERKDLISASNKGKSRTPEQRARLADHCRKLAEARKGKPSPKSPEHKAKLVEHCRKLALHQKGKPLQPEHAENVRRAARLRQRGVDGKFITPLSQS